MYAEEIGNYWKTSRTSPDRWIEKARDEIARAGGLVLAEGFGNEPQTGRAAYMLAFELGGDHFKIIWPVLLSKMGYGGAARIQAATALYREVKAACVKAKFLGNRAAFFAYLLLPDGRTASQASVPELLEALPKLLAVVQIEGLDCEARQNASL